MRRLLGSPLLHFVVLGALLYGASRLAREPGPDYVIRLSAQDVSELADDWRQLSGREPSAEELRRMIATRFDEELLLAEAFALGWHRSDAIAQRRLLQNQRFLEPESEQSDAALLERAYAQGMDRSDIVVRRRLLERMKLAIATGARSPEPSEAELEQYLASHADTFRRPARIRLSHVYLSRDLRGKALARDAATLGARLRAEAIAPEAAFRLGDPFLLSSQLPLYDEAGLARQLGPEFAAGAFGTASESWSEPIASSYGLHLVWVHERVESELPALPRIRAQVQSELLREREQRAIREHIAALRERAELQLAKGGG